ncbi:MAG TPA: flagellar hook-length control protein FliK [Rhizobiales bacterium]|nr:flagellar hook-length control protein FliK [Hyphomicrobiales bacterium]
MPSVTGEWEIVICVTFFMFINHMDISLLPGPPPDAQLALKTGATDMAALKNGEIIEARVAQILAKGVVQLDLGGARVMVKSQLSLLAGQKLTLQVEQGKGGLKLVLLDPSAGKAPAKSGQPLLQSGAGQAIVSGRGMPAMENAGLSSRPQIVKAAIQDMPQSLKMLTGAKPGQMDNPARAQGSLRGEALPILKSGSGLQVVVSKAIKSAITYQNSLSGVFAEARQLLNVSGDSLPDKVGNALKALLALRLSGHEKISATDIKQAFSRSGIFMENRQAGGSLQEGSDADLKSALVRLRGVLRNWLGAKARPLPPPETRVLPPFKKGRPQGQPPRAPVVDGGAALPEAGRVLLGEVRAALSRLTLLQAASLPSHGDGNSQRANLEWNFEVPFRLGNETAIAQFRIDSEAEGDTASDERRWSIEVSLDSPETGPVHAALGLRGNSLRVNLWAVREDILNLFRSQKGLLKAALEEKGLEGGNISFHKGAPHMRVLSPGSMMDQMR